MLLLGIWHNNYNLRYVSTTHVQFTFSAGTVFVLSAIQAISGPRLGRVTLASSLSQVETCLEYLAIIGQSRDPSAEPVACISSGTRRVQVSVCVTSEVLASTDR